ncbi:YbaK/EbsC family protein [Candidatus Latescibacterota bacterium]
MFDTIKDWIRSQSIDFREVHHEPTRTSLESAEARGEDLSTGGKALVLKAGDVFTLHVLSASKKLDSQAVKKHLNAKKIRFASKDELLELTGLPPGAVPPFGKPILDIDLFVDTSILQSEKIAFNAGSLTDSIVMKTDDYIEIANAEIYVFSTE